MTEGGEPYFYQADDAGLTVTSHELAVILDRAFAPLGIAPPGFEHWYREAQRKPLGYSR